MSDLKGNPKKRGERERKEEMQMGLRIGEEKDDEEEQKG